jgi:hypothetical protein
MDMAGHREKFSRMLVMLVVINVISGYTAFYFGGPAPNGADGAKTSTLTETPKER